MSKKNRIVSDVEDEEDLATQEPQLAELPDIYTLAEGDVWVPFNPLTDSIPEDTDNYFVGTEPEEDLLVGVTKFFNTDQNKVYVFRGTGAGDEEKIWEEVSGPRYVVSTDEDTKGDYIGKIVNESLELESSKREKVHVKVTAMLNERPAKTLKEVLDDL